MAKMGRPKKPPKFKEILSELLPTDEIFSPEEKILYDGLVAVYLKDFDEEQLTANDIDDILSIAMNRVLEIRLLKASKGDTIKHIDASTAIEKLRRQTEKLKENLVSRRKDRIDPKKYSGFSIVDLAVAFDEEKKNEAAARINRFRMEEDELTKSKLLIGNSNDEDASFIDKDD